MLTSRRDYLLRIIDEVGRMLARVIFHRQGDRPQDALQAVVQACERLFSMEADKLFQFTPEQHFEMLTEGERTETARNKVLLYAALNAEAGRIYQQMTNPTMALGSFQNALRFTLQAEESFPREHWPEFAPNVENLLSLVQSAPLDEEIRTLLKNRG